MMRSLPCPTCFVCGATGVPLYHGLEDRLFSAPGTWDISRCPTEECGMLWLDPMPIPDDIGEAYKDYLTHGWTARPRVSRFRRAYLNATFGYAKPPSPGTRIVDALLAAVFRLRFRRRSDIDGRVFHLKRRSNNPRVLDVGCGSGDSMVLLEMLGWKPEGIEFDPKAAEIARSKGFTVHLGGLSDHKFDDNTFDAIVLGHVIEHVHEPIAVMSECRRLLKPGGELVMLTPNAASLGHRFYGIDWLALDPPRHLHIFTPRAMQESLRRAGFTDINVTSTARAGDHIALHSHEIGRHGRAREETKPGWGWLRIARMLQFLEVVALKFNGQIGEEIVVRARK